MATLPTLALGTFTNVTGSVIVGTEPVLQLIADAVDSRYVYSGNNNATGTYSANFALADTPTDFGNMDTLAVRLRYLISAAATNTCTLSVRVFQSDGTTALTDAVQVVANVNNTAAENGTVVTLTGLNTTANKAVWDGALVRIDWGLTKVKGGDSNQRRVTAAELTGTYSLAIINRNGTLDGTLTAVTGALTGEYTRNGTLDGELTAITGAFTGEYTRLGAFAGTLDAVTGAFTGSVIANRDGTLDGELTAITGSFAGEYTRLGTFDGTLAAVTGAFNGIAGVIEQNGTLDGTLAAITGAVAGLADQRAVYLNTTQTLTGAVRQQVDNWGSREISWTVVRGGLPANTPLEHAVMSWDGKLGWSPYTVEILALQLTARGFGA